MDEPTKTYLLKNFFSGYFHQDWPCDAKNAEAIVATYRKTAPPNDIRILSQAISEYSRSFSSDEQLEKKLFADLGCYYCPSGDGISAKVWFETLADELLRDGQS